jgi:diadenylate cyclase
MFEHLCHLNVNCNQDVMRSVVALAVELAREGREGRRVGTIFMVGDHEHVLRLSRPLILDPLSLHEPRLRSIHDLNLRETVKELSQLDGAFVISNDGTVEAACRYLDAGAGDLELHLGLGSRHIAGAAMTRVTQSTAIVVSESAVVRIFFEGELVAEIVPELWLLTHEMIHLKGPIEERDWPGVKIFSKRKS